MKFIIISSTKNITVTHSISGVDRTNYESHTGNNLNIAPMWTKNTVDIREGQHKYPAEIAEWPTVKMLEERKIITIGREADEDEASQEEIDAAKKFDEASSAIESAESATTKRRRKKAEEPAE